MAKLSVNINKIATLRNARGSNNPNVLQVALDCERFGAEGITVHPRPDERHIRYADVLDLAPAVKTEFNIEGYPDERFMEMVARVKPAQATLVPDGPHVLTSNAGWDTVKHQSFLSNIIARLKESGTRVSVFTDPDEKYVSAAAHAGANRIELYTEPYAQHYLINRDTAIAPYKRCAELAVSLGMGLNAGHDLDLINLPFLIHNIPQISEVSIGHALISDALYFGLENTIALYLRAAHTK
ncbi:MAG: pyridoxine 5'-phosphate synthase [Bacteroidota bacterium]